MFGLIYKLQHIINSTYDHSDVNTVLAEYLLQNINSAPELTIQKIVEVCNVSPSSITRFSKYLGYSGFMDLKHGLATTYLELEEMKIDLDVPSNYFNEESYINYINNNADMIVSSIQNLTKSITYNETFEITKKIHKANRIIFFATQAPASIITIVQHQLLTSGKYAIYYPMHCDQLLLSKNLKQNDLVFYVSLSGSYVSQKDIVLNVLSSNSYNILMSQNKKIKLSSEFDEVIQLGIPDSELSGKYKLLLYFENLMQLYYNKFIVKENNEL